MDTKLTIDWPEPLLEEARQAAFAHNKSLEGLVLQAVSELTQRQNGKSTTKQVQRSKSNGNSTEAQSSKKHTTQQGWTTEQFVRDRTWIDNNYDSLVEDYPDQWIIVYDRKVCGADRDFGKAQELAEPVIGDIHEIGALAVFVEASWHVF